LVAGGRSGGGGGGGDGSGQRRRRRRKRGGGSGSGGKMTKAAAVILFCGGTGLPEIHICDWVMHACIPPGPGSCSSKNKVEGDRNIVFNTWQL
jgi:hypothetical protein